MFEADVDLLPDVDDEVDHFDWLERGVCDFWEPAATEVGTLE